MIGVIADDLSGAAEIAGLAYRYGLDPVVCLDPSQAISGERICVWDTDTRSCRPEEAARRIEKTAVELRRKNPDWIFKKVDSVLRGNIAVELETLGRLFKAKRIILIPANPSLGRTINAGRYYIDGCLLEKTDFIEDPELRAKTSRVVDLLGPLDRGKAVSAQVEDYCPHPEQKGIICGDATTIEEVARWAGKLDKDTLPAGGSDFFTAILEKRGFQLIDKFIPLKWPSRTLLISGTAAPASGDRITKAESEGIPVCRMPVQLMSNNTDFEKFIDEWEIRATACLHENNRVIVTIGRARSEDPNDPPRLGKYLCELTRRLLCKEKIAHLCIEGGATASRIIRGQNWNYLKVIHEWTRGVVSMRIPIKSGPILTIKPGSYPWPGELWGSRRLADN